MALISDVQLACARLAPHGWHTLLLQQGLDITATDLQQELSKVLSVDRSLKGFEDFSPTGSVASKRADPRKACCITRLLRPMC